MFAAGQHPPPLSPSPPNRQMRCLGARTDRGSSGQDLILRRTQNRPSRRQPSEVAAVRMVCGARSMSFTVSHGPNIAAPNRARDDECFCRLPRSLWLSSVVSRFTLQDPPFLRPSVRFIHPPAQRARSKTTRVDLHNDGSATTRVRLIASICNNAKQGSRGGLVLACEHVDLGRPA